MGAGWPSSECVKPSICPVSAQSLEVAMRARTGMTAVAMATMMLYTGCATAPRGPSVQVLPGTGKPFEQFQADVEVCPGWPPQHVTPAFTAPPASQLHPPY